MNFDPNYLFETYTKQDTYNFLNYKEILSSLPENQIAYNPLNNEVEKYNQIDKEQELFDEEAHEQIENLWDTDSVPLNPFLSQNKKQKIEMNLNLTSPYNMKQNNQDNNKKPQKQLLELIMVAMQEQSLDIPNFNQAIDPKTQLKQEIQKKQIEHENEHEPKKIQIEKKLTESNNDIPVTKQIQYQPFTSIPFKQKDLNVSKPQGCTCKRSKCLKLYCECFSNDGYCSPQCKCFDCLNQIKHEKVRQKAINDAKERNPNNFQGKSKQSDEKGCNCKKTKCILKYCECFLKGQVCGINCKCCDCQNCGLADESCSSASTNFTGKEKQGQ